MTPALSSVPALPAGILHSGSYLAVGIRKGPLCGNSLHIHDGCLFSLVYQLGIVTWQGVVCIFVGYVVASLLIMVFYVSFCCHGVHCVLVVCGCIRTCRCVLCACTCMCTHLHVCVCVSCMLSVSVW